MNDEVGTEQLSVATPSLSSFCLSHNSCPNEFARASRPRSWLFRRLSRLAVDFAAIRPLPSLA